MRSEALRFVDLSENRPGKFLRAYVRAMCGGSTAIIHAFLDSDLYLRDQKLPGLAEMIIADNQWWEAHVAEDGLDSTRTWNCRRPPPRRPMNAPCETAGHI